MGSLLLLLLSFLPFFSYRVYSLTIDSSGFIYQDLTSTNGPAFASELSYWTPTASTSPYYTTANTEVVAGGYNIGGTFSRTYTGLPAHNAIYITLRIFIFDDWIKTDYVTVSFDSSTVNVGGFGRTLTGLTPFQANLFGSPSYKDLGVIDFTWVVPHIAGSVAVTLTPSLTYAKNRQSFGFRDLNMKFTYRPSYIPLTYCGFNPYGLLGTFPSCGCAASAGAFMGCSGCDYRCSSCLSATNTSECITCTSPGLFNNTHCKSCHSQCQSCNGAFDCNQCNPGYYLYWDNSTCNDCPVPLIQNNTAGVDRCNTPCMWNETLYWDNTCNSTGCWSPATSVTKANNVTLCTYTCSSPDYLFFDGGCYPSGQCTFPLYYYIFKGKDFCGYPCLSSQYLFDNGTCSATCVFPFANQWIKSRNFCKPQCSNLSHYAYQDGTCSSTCPAPFISSMMDGLLVCLFPCELSNFYYQNTTCNASCNSPFVQSIVTIYKYCNHPCSLSDYYYQNNTCSSTCTGSFTPNAVGIYKYCNFKCLLTEYMNSLGVCIPTCTTPSVSYMESIYPYCDLVCTQQLYQNSTCMPTCAIHFVSSYSNYHNFCDFVCPSGEYLYYNNSCLPTCPSYLRATSYGYEQYCDLPCPSTEYVNTNLTCFATCTTPFFPGAQYGLNYCYTPCTNSTQFVLRNGTCVSDCSSPWTIPTNTPYPLCDSACSSYPSTYFLSSVGTCEANCVEPAQAVLDLYYNYCEGPCGSKYYKVDSGTCVDACTFPYKESNITFIKTCVMIVVEQTAASALSNGALQANQVGQTVGGALGSAGGGASAFGMLTLARFLFYTRYIQMNYPQNVRDYYIAANSTGSISIGVILPTGGLEFPKEKPIPAAFDGWGNSSSFIVNYWSTFSTVVVTIGIAIMTSIIKKGFEKWKKRELTFLFEKLKILFMWNFVLIQFCPAFDVIAFYASCEFRTFLYDGYPTIISLLFGIIIIFVAVIFFYLSIKLGIEHAKASLSVAPASSNPDEKIISPVQEFRKKWEPFQMLYMGYKNDSIFAQLFVFFSMVRAVLWVTILAIFYEYPLVQIVLLTTLSFLVLLMIIIKKPFLKMITVIEFALYEVIILFVHICILIIGIWDSQGHNDEGQRESIGTAIIYGFSIFGIVALGFMIFSFVLGLISAIKTFRKMKAAGSVGFVLLLTIPFASYGMDFEDLTAQDPKQVLAAEKKKKATFKVTPIDDELDGSKSTARSNISQLYDYSDNQDLLRSTMDLTAGTAISQKALAKYSKKGNQTAAAKEIFTEHMASTMASIEKSMRSTKKSHTVVPTRAANLFNEVSFSHDDKAGDNMMKELKLDTNREFLRKGSYPGLEEENNSPTLFKESKNPFDESIEVGGVNASNIGVSDQSFKYLLDSPGKTENRFTPIKLDELGESIPKNFERKQTRGLSSEFATIQLDN